MKTIVVIPTYNEAENVPGLIKAIRAEVKVPLDILVVDSASPDKTADRVRILQESDPNLYLLEQKAKLGLGKAYLDGMNWVLARDYDALITMDADFSHQPKYLNDHLREIKTHDLAVGSRYVKNGGMENWPKYRLFLSSFANWYAGMLMGLPFHDLTSGFQCFRTELLRKLLRYNIHTEGYAFLVELKFLAIIQEARYAEFPIIFPNRRAGDSKISKRVIFESMLFVMKRSLQRGRVKRALSAVKTRKKNEMKNAPVLN